MLSLGTRYRGTSQRLVIAVYTSMLLRTFGPLRPPAMLL
jgi:hypothetical protein